MGILLVAFGAGGCASKVIEGDLLSLEPPRKAAGEFRIGDMLPWTQGDHSVPAALEEQTGEVEWTTAFEIVEGPDAGRTLLQVRTNGEEPGSWSIVRRIEGVSKPMEERHQTMDPSDRSLVLPHSLNFERGVRVEMNPAPITVPGRIEPGRTLSRELRIRLPLIENPKRLREKGTALSEITYVDDQHIRTAAGRLDAKHLREVFTSRFTAATAVRTIDRWFAPGMGLVAERWAEDVSVLGVVIERTRFAMRILPPMDRPVDEPAPPREEAPEPPAPAEARPN